MILHLDTFIHGIADPFISSRYVGFVAIAAVTVYELAIKEIFLEFSSQKHKVFANFTEMYFYRINGRIKTKTIQEDYLVRFGDKYVKRFKNKINKAEKEILRRLGISILSSYNNVIEWRNQFAHQGVVPSFVTYNEVNRSYQAGKEIIKCLADTMRR